MLRQVLPRHGEDSLLVSSDRTWLTTWPTGRLISCARAFSSYGLTFVGYVSDVACASVRYPRSTRLALISLNRFLEFCAATDPRVGSKPGEPCGSVTSGSGWRNMATSTTASAVD